MIEQEQLEHAGEETLDPVDWEALRTLGHRMVDDVVRYHATVAERPVWQPMPDASREALRRPLPREPEGAAAAYEEFVEHVLPYPFGNIHPRGWGWVNGTGTTLGAFAEMLAATMNSNCWGGDQAAAHVEAQVLDWLKQSIGFPAAASGLLVSGGSVANLIALAAARDAHSGGDVSTIGVRALDAPLVVYTSDETHNSVDKAVGLLGIGTANLRRIPTDDSYRIEVGALRRAIAADREAGLRPVCVVANAGTVNTGAIDDLDALADICAEERIWLHVDGAFGALAALAPELRPRLAGMERADSIAFDLHKWLYMPIEVGCVLVRDPEAHHRPFSPRAAYLERFDRGPAHGTAYSTLGPQLTRGFRALKVWLSLKAHGSESYARLIAQNVAQAERLATLIRSHPSLELAAPVGLCVVCFRYVDAAFDDTRLDEINRETLLRLQESGIAVPSSTRLRGRFVLRVALTNHRTRAADLELLVRETARTAADIANEP